MGPVRTVRRRIATSRARAMRAAPTRAEAKMWALLRAGRLEGWKWKRQVPIGPYKAVFVCREVQLIAEIDGAVHALQEDYDARRTAVLQSSGWRVLRFTNCEVLDDSSGVCGAVLRAVEAR